MNTTVSLELTKAQAFCLFELLAKQVYDRRAFVPSQAQTELLRETCEALDDELVERFREEYVALTKRRQSEHGA